MTLVIDDLSFAYGDVKALEHIAAEAAPGRLTAIIGPNASGKSTLLRCIIGSLKPSGGRVLLDGVPTRHLRPRFMARRMAYVAQRSAVSAAFTVTEVVELGRYALAPSRRLVEQAIARLDLSDVAHRPYAALSVGQQQRVMLARAVAQLDGAGYLLLDEPTSAMDLRHQCDTMTLIRELVGEGVTVLMVMHDLTTAAAEADVAWLLQSGRLAAAGPAGEVLTESRLREVFNVPFEWLSSSTGGRRLAPITSSRSGG